MIWTHTPVPYTLDEVFFALQERQDCLFWLDSADTTQANASRSLLTLRITPLAVIQPDGTLVVHEGPAHHREHATCWEQLDAIVGDADQDPQAPGVVGWVSYTAGFLGKENLSYPPHPTALPMLELYRVRAALMDARGRVVLATSGRSETEASLAAEAWMRTISKAVEEQVSNEPIDHQKRPKELICQDGGSKETYLQWIAEIQRAIHRGELRQVCPTYPIRFERPASMAAWYGYLRHRSPAGYCAFVRTPTLECASTSPEFLFEIHDDMISTRPMKGTRRRGLAPDDVTISELQNNPKDQAENLMVAEQAVLDIAPICVPGTAVITQKFTVETYATVMQLTSTVEGKLLPNVGPFSAYAALTPPASMTGEPKPAALRVLERIEQQPRGLYSGSVLWIDGEGHTQFNCLIRSLWAYGDGAAWHVGGGIVQDSDPQAEWTETRTKAVAILPDE